MFETEDELVKALKGSLGPLCEWSFDSNTVILEQVGLGYGVADIVASQVFPGSQTGYYMNDVEVHIYEIIRKYPNQNLSDLLHGSKVNINQLRDVLKSLLQHKYVQEEEGYFSLLKRYENIVGNNVAIEAKLRNWKRALYQAFRYKWFAFYSYVVLDSRYIKPALRNIEEFEHRNVGLAEIDLNGVCIVHYRPYREQPISSNMTVLFNEHVRKFLE